MSTRGLLAICEIGAALQRGDKVSRAHVDSLQRVYPVLPRFVLDNYARELNAVPDAAGRVRQFLHRVAGNDAPRYHAVLDDYQRRMTAEQVSDKLSERDQASRARFDAIRAGRTREENARLDARIRDQNERRTILTKLVNANPKHKEPDLIDHGNRLDAGAKVLYRSGALKDPSVSVRDSLRAAFDSHAAINAGKEAGIFSESEGVGDIGAEAPDAAAILEGDATWP